MNQETLAELVTYAQSGNGNALEQLLIWAYTPVSFLCRKLLKDNDIAEAQTREILQAIVQRLPSLQSPSAFEKWVIRLASLWCIQYQKENAYLEEEPAEETELPIAGEALDELQTVEAVQKMVDMLSVKPRTCMTLLCCCEMSSSDIARITGDSIEDVRQNMGQAQSFVLEQMQKYQELGTEFYPITSLTDVLQSGMRYEKNEEASAVVYSLLGKTQPTPPDPNRGRKILLVVGIVAMIFLNLALGVLNLLVKKHNTFAPQDYHVEEVATPTAETQPEEITAPETVEETEAIAQ